ncbi:MAG: hypothetical protein GY838_00190 [bacterium]|nr:hypothetical protein [bacterium]
MINHIRHIRHLVNTQTAGAATKKAIPAGLVPVLTLVATLVMAGCGGGDDPSEPSVQLPPGPAGVVPPAAVRACSWPAGRWEWTWSASANGPRGTAALRITPTPDATKWAWAFTPEPPPGRPLDLTPLAHDRWLAFRWDGRDLPGPLPLPRTAVASGHYSDLVDLLRDLTTLRFGAVVTGWTDDPDDDHRARPPIPVDPGAPVTGPVDLAACLRRAMDVWNAGAPSPWFVEAAGTGWGVRLIHYPERSLRPPLYVQLTRLDAFGRPARLNIYAGDNYTDPGDSVYALRGFVHELGHALLLMGHSADRSHTLWERSSPLVSAPSLDERKAARLWHGLPEGIDLQNYRILTPPVPSRAPWPPAGHP